MELCDLQIGLEVICGGFWPFIYGYQAGHITTKVNLPTFVIIERALIVVVKVKSPICISIGKDDREIIGNLSSASEYGHDGIR